MKVAFIVCGQIRSIEDCFPTWKDYLFSCYPDYDVYVATQDANAIKGRIYIEPIVVNQYLFQPITYNIEEKLKSLFGKNLKGIRIRSRYEYYIINQTSDFVLKNTFGWAENFLDMKYALEMAGEDYDLYIKIRPDIFFCKAFLIEEVEKNTIYVNDKREDFVWDAVFAMDKIVAKKMMGFYDFYIEQCQTGLTKCFDGWDCSMNAEDKLLSFLKLHQVNIEDMGELGYPITWLVGDIKNNYGWSQRHLNFNDYYKRELLDYAGKHVSCCFDICQHGAMEPQVHLNRLAFYGKHKIAILICGQWKPGSLLGLQSIYEHVFVQHSDVYIVTQDCVSIKPRYGLENQYLIVKAEPNIEYAKSLFGENLKAWQIRETYHENMMDMGCNMCFKTKIGKKDFLNDMEKAFSMAGKYDFYVVVRPDCLITKPLIMTCRIKNMAYGSLNLGVMDGFGYKDYLPLKTQAISFYSLLRGEKNLWNGFSHKWKKAIGEYLGNFKRVIFDFLE